MKSAFWVLLLGISTNAMGQVAINNTSTLPHASAMLDISSTNRGLLVPRMTQAQRNAIVSPATGLMIYQTDNTPGYYFNSGSPATPQWVKMAAAGDQGLGLQLPYNGVYTGDVAFSIYNTGYTAIQGASPANNGYGVIGFAMGQGGSGVLGSSEPTTGWGMGVQGVINGPSGIGVYGRASQSNGTATGVTGSTQSPDGTGVYGENLAMTGASVGIRGHVNSPQGYSGVFSGGMFYVTGRTGIGVQNPEAGLHVKGSEFPNSFLFLQSDAGKDAGIRFYEGPAAKWHWFNNALSGGLQLYNSVGQTAMFVKQENSYVGIGTTTPAASLDVNGTVKISGGTPGVGKVLTSDASGLSSWQKVKLALPYRDTVNTVQPLLALVNQADDGVTISAVSGGTAIAALGVQVGVIGETNYPTGKGIFGAATSAIGGTVGVHGDAASPSGYGVYGRNYAASGNTKGVYGHVISATGTGVYGLGGSKGVHGEVQNGTGVYAEALATSGNNYGVYANTNSSSGIGVYGRASASTGLNFGVYGTSLSTGGIAVYGYAPAATGSGVGVRGEVNSADGFSGWFYGGRFFVNGRVGIGTTTPAAGLHVKATGFPNSFMYLEAADNQDAGFRLYEGTVDQWHIFNSASADGLQIYNNAGTTAFFAKQSNGYVGIGTTAPTQLLDVNGVARIRGMMTGIVSTTVYRTADGTLITGASDIRLKENIEPLQNSLEKVLQLKGVTFNWKADPQKRRSIGFVAQDFEKVLPELVFTNDNDGYKGINYAEVTAVLTEAVKQLKAENDALKARLEKLEKLLNATTRQ